jgi:hypothetical protein
MMSANKYGNKDYLNHLSKNGYKVVDVDKFFEGIPNDEYRVAAMKLYKQVYTRLTKDKYIGGHESASDIIKMSFLNFGISGDDHKAGDVFACADIELLPQFLASNAPETIEGFFSKEAQDLPTQISTIALIRVSTLGVMHGDVEHLRRQYSLTDQQCSEVKALRSNPYLKKMFEEATQGRSMLEFYPPSDVAKQAHQDSKLQEGIGFDVASDSEVMVVRRSSDDKRKEPDVYFLNRALKGTQAIIEAVAQHKQMNLINYGGNANLAAQLEHMDMSLDNFGYNFVNKVHANIIRTVYHQLRPDESPEYFYSSADKSMKDIFKEIKLTSIWIDPQKLGIEYREERGNWKGGLMGDNVPVRLNVINSIDDVKQVWRTLIDGHTQSKDVDEINLWGSDVIKKKVQELKDPRLDTLMEKGEYFLMQVNAVSGDFTLYDANSKIDVKIKESEKTKTNSPEAKSAQAMVDDRAEVREL